MYRLRCEWDIGQDDLVFTSVKALKNWAARNPNIGSSFEVLEGEGLIGIEPLELIIDDDENEDTDEER